MGDSPPTGETVHVTINGDRAQARFESGWHTSMLIKNDSTATQIASVIATNLRMMCTYNGNQTSCGVIAHVAPADTHNPDITMFCPRLASACTMQQPKPGVNILLK